MTTLAIILFWGNLCILFYIYFGYTLLLYFISRIKPVAHSIKEDFYPPVTILFAGRNELGSLPGKLESIRALDYPSEQIQILIASDDSTDGTNEFLDQQDDVELVILKSHSGKNAALNELLPKASGDILFFTDANNKLDPSCLKAAVRHFYDPQIGAVAGELVFTQDEPWNPVGRGTGLYWHYENWIKRSESRLGSVLVAAGSMLTCRTGLIDRLNPRIANDLEIPARIGAQGYQVLYEKDCVGYEKPHTNVWEEFWRTSRIVARGLQGFICLFPTLLKSPLRFWQFFSHKFLRWFTLVYCFFLLWSAWMLRESWFYYEIFTIGCALLVCSLVGMIFIDRKNSPRLLRPCSLLSHLLIMNLAALWGLFLSLIGQAPATWSIPKSTREQK